LKIKNKNVIAFRDSIPNDDDNNNYSGHRYHHFMAHEQIRSDYYYWNVGLLAEWNGLLLIVDSRKVPPGLTVLLHLEM
jgi:hypothetical protein